MTTPGRGGSPARVRVTSPRRTAKRPEERSRYRDLVEETALGEVYVDAILRAQRRLAYSVVVGIAALVGVLGGALLLVPQALNLAIVGLPVVWVMLGVLVYPVALLMTWGYVRVAERIEREFVDLMDQP